MKPAALHAAGNVASSLPACPDPDCAHLNNPGVRYCAECGKALLPYDRAFLRRNRGAPRAGPPPQRDAVSGRWTSRPKEER